jgi:ribonuclease P protein subunit RPR2
MLARQQAKEIAKERIDMLIKCALKEKDQALAALQARQAKKIAMRFRVRVPYEARQLFCKRCKTFIVPGRSARVRIGRAKTRAIRVTCFLCGHTYHKVLGRNKDL